MGVEGRVEFGMRCPTKDRAGSGRDFRDLDQRDQHMPLSTLISLYIPQCSLPNLKYKRSIGQVAEGGYGSTPSKKNWTMFYTVSP